MGLWLMFESKKPRRVLWQHFYSFVSWVFPNRTFHVMNAGYALLSDDGVFSYFDPSIDEKREIYQY